MFRRVNRFSHKDGNRLIGHTVIFQIGISVLSACVKFSLCRLEFFDKLLAKGTGEVYVILVWLLRV